MNPIQVGTSDRPPLPARLHAAAEQLRTEVARLQDLLAEMHGSTEPTKLTKDVPETVSGSISLETALQAAEECLRFTAKELTDIRDHLRNFLLG